MDDLEVAAGPNPDRKFFQVEFPDARIKDGKIEHEHEHVVRAAREEIRARIIALFANSMMGLKDAEDGKSICRSYVRMPGTATKYFDADDLVRAEEDAARLLDVDDPDFNAAVADINAGAIIALGKVVNLTLHHGDPHAAFKQLQQVARDARVRITAIKAPGFDDIPAGWTVERPLAQVPWVAESGVSRKDVLAGRVLEMDRVDIAAYSEKHLAEIMRRFPKQAKWFKESLLGAYEKACERCKLSPFQRTQFRAVSLSAIILRDVKAITKPIGAALGALKNGLAAAATEAHMIAAIDGFAQEALPEAIKAEAPADASRGKVA